MRRRSGVRSTLAIVATLALALSSVSVALARVEASRDRVSGGAESREQDLTLVGRGERLLAGATTDVWSLGEHAYLGTFNHPCGTGENFVPGVGPVDLVDDIEAPGVVVFDITEPAEPTYVGNLPSVEGSRVNDVKAATLGSGDVLAHSNEPCDGGRGGIELYDVDDPLRPVHLASIRIDELNPVVDEMFGGITDVGVHNLWLFSQDGRDYVSVVAETVFGNFQTFDITDPSEPVWVSAWGAEEVFDPGVGAETEDEERVGEAVDWIFDGPGSSAHKFLHDITYDLDGRWAWLSNWDAGLILMDMEDPARPRFVSQAIDLEEGSLDEELNSHAAWPSEDGTVVVETEEDFAAWERTRPPVGLTFGDEEEDDAPLPGVAVSTDTGDALQESPTGNTGTLEADALTVEEGPLAGTTYEVAELAGDQPKLADTGPVSGDLVYVGRACEGDEIDNAGEIEEGGIAVVRRGECTFREKNQTAQAAGADAVVIANNVEVSTPWGGVRIWDYSDPEEPVLASTFYTDCAAAAEPIEGCDPLGTYSVHNVQVETHGETRLAYISWYRDGMLVLDVTDPHEPVEVARFFDDSQEFREDNGGSPHDFWGVHKQRGKPSILGADRNGGLYVFELEQP